MQSKGEYRVGITFNPSANDKVAQIKRAAADLIDLIETIDVTGMDVMHAAEVGPLKTLAQRDVERAAMWAVKAATKPPMSA